jgi:predicted outer membrane lipoprotein
MIILSDTNNPFRFFNLLAGMLLACAFAIAIAIPVESFACHKNDKPHGPNADSCDGGGGGGDGGGGSGGGAIPLCVDFRDAENDNFASDDEPPPYCDGDEQVGAGIDKFRFGLNVSQSGPRNFFLDLTKCFDSSCTPPSLPGDPPLSVGLTRGWNVFSTSPDGAQFLRMTKDDTQLVDFQLDFFDADDRLWRIQFDPDLCPLTSSVTATKTSDDPDTWTFEANEGVVACLQLREGGKKHFTFHGLYYMPFQIVAERQ